MRRDRKAIEAEMAERGLSGMRVTADSIDRRITSSQYHQFEGTTVTVCLIHLDNGFSVLGQSACVDPANFRKDLGEKLAFDDAKDKIWQLEGYLLAELRKEMTNAAV